MTSGLDSQMAVRLIQSQSVEVVAIHFQSPWGDTTAAAETAARSLDVPLTVMDLGEAYAESLRRPRFGFVAGAAPCLDCRIAMLRMARERLQPLDAEFVVTGEVVGQRVRTAVRDLELIDHHAGLTGRVLRPLSARLLPATEPEDRGWIDRTQLLDWQGKSRQPQVQLATRLGLPLVPPRPDCPLLAEPLAARALELIRSPGPLLPWALATLTVGRQFRLDEQTRVVIGRNREENELLGTIAEQAGPQSALLLTPENFRGPTSLLIGNASGANVQRAVELVARYSRPLPPLLQVRIGQGGELREFRLPETP